MRAKMKEHEAKVILYGDRSVGKTALVQRWGSDSFPETFQSTLGVDFESKTISSKQLGISLGLEFWDIDGQNRFAHMMPFYLKDCDVVLLMFSVTDRASFNHLRDYYETAKKNSPEDAQYFLLGNKIDLKSGIQVSREEAAEFALANNLIYIETSANTGEGLDVLGQEMLISTHNKNLSAAEELTRKRSSSFSMFAPHEMCSDVSYRQKEEDLGSHSQTTKNSNQLKLFKEKRQSAVGASPAHHGEIKNSSVS